MIFAADFLEEIKAKDRFIELVHIDFERQAQAMGVTLHWNKGRAQDAYFQWMQDLERIEMTESEVTSADAYKRAAHLIYWLRRSSSADNFVRMSADSEPVTDQQAFMFRYGREYLAFDLGYRALHSYEIGVNDRKLGADAFSLESSLEGVPQRDFIVTAVHVLKLKNVSPHAIYLVLKAIFLRP